MNKKFFSILLVIILAFSIFLAWPASSPLSPLIQPGLKDSLTQSSDFLIIGFLPYWNYRKLSPQALDNTTHIAYFSLRLAGNGNIQKYTSSVAEEPGWTRFKKIQTSPLDKPTILTFAQANTKEVEALLNNPNSRRVAINTIISFVDDGQFAGINIDLEPSGGIAPSLRNNFTLFIQELRTRLDQLSDLDSPLPLSIDVYPTAASKKRLWDLTALEPHVDHFIVMTYDYHRASSNSSGPNAPLRGSPLSFDEDILKNISEIVSTVPSEKIILGIPFYGYEWHTLTKDKYAKTIGSGAVASFKRIDEILFTQNPPVLWDRNSLTPYIILEEDDSISQIYFDNSHSIGLKLDLVKQANLAGIAIWALGYEGDNSPIWPTIKTLH